jgi:hypothetical protein
MVNVIGVVNQSVTWLTNFNSSFPATPQARFISDKIGKGSEEVLIFQIRKQLIV